MRIIPVALLSVFLASCDNPSVEESSITQGLLTACPDFSETGKPPIVQNAQCGVLHVKENPQDASSREIGLNILRLPAINPTPQPDPLFIIAGGPGQSAVEIAEHIFYTFNEVRKNRDIVFIDQRGTGKSNPLECAEFDEVHYQLSLLEQQQRLKTIVQACAEKLGEQLQFYTTPYAVQDLDTVRQVLGYQRINVWGVSYGTRVALEYMRRYPEATRSSILDGVAPVNIALPWHGGEDALASLRLLGEQCSAMDACAEKFGDVLRNAESIAQRLAEQPVEVTVAHPRTQAPFTLSMNHQIFASMIRMALYTRDLSVLLPLAISNAQDDNYDLLASLIVMAGEQTELMGISYGMHFTVLCNEDYPQYQSRTEASVDFLSANLATAFADVCEIWPRYPLDENYFTPIESDIPTLMLSGQRDPVTPPRWAEQVGQHLSQARHLIAPGGHHSITHDGCVAQLIAQFIQRASAETLETDCVENIQPLTPYFAVGQAVETDTDAEDTSGEPTP